jgi:hypothetical protein
MLNMACGNPENPYGKLIMSFLSQVIPANMDNPANQLDAVTEAFLSSAQNRFGPRPGPESTVAIRSVLRHWMDENCSIPVLLPWGSKKTRNDADVDIAELMALRQVQALNERVRRFYTPGIAARFGIEDLGGFYTWKDEGPETFEASYHYTDRFVRLIKVLEMDSFMTPAQESWAVSSEVFNAKADEFFAPLLDYLSGSVLALGKMHELGWVGDVPTEMRDFYYASYEKLYPGASHSYRMRKLAMYLAQSAARYALRVKTNNNWGSNYIQINFPFPVPGVPEALSSKRLFYRTLPLRFAKTHIPPWRAKGYLRIDNQNNVTPKLASFNDLPVGLQHDVLHLTNGVDSMELSADFVIVD